jgi:hypothetical protein
VDQRRDRRSSARIVSATLVGLATTSAFQKRITLKPVDSIAAVRAAS